MGVVFHGTPSPRAVPPDAIEVTQGLYSRDEPLADGGTQPIRPQVADPDVSGRIWALGLRFAQLGYSDDDGATFTSVGAHPGKAAGLSHVQMLFSDTYVWALSTGSKDGTGKLFRSPKPAADGTGISWTEVFDFATDGGSSNSSFRNACLAVSEPYCYLVEYGDVVTGGPSIYTSDDDGATWAKSYTWANGKHAHAVKVIDGTPWVMIGDGGYSDLGLWSATTTAATTFGRRSIYGEDAGGNTLYGINFFDMAISSASVIVSESDTRHGHGPYVFPGNTSSVTSALVPLCHVYAPYLGTMRQLTLTSEGNLMWVQTGESGAVGPTDSVWIAKPPFTQPILLEQVALDTFGTMGDPVECGDYVWFGTHRIRKEVFVDQ